VTVNHQHKRIVLASGSPRRRELLSQLGVEFDVITSDVDERVSPGLEASEVVMQLAERKATAVAALVQDGFVIGADTIVVVDDQILGKPASHGEAASMLQLLAGRAHTVFTGVAILDANTGKKRVSYRSTVVHMRNVDEADIDRYIRTGEPMDKAGAYAIQGIGSIFVTAIEGCYFTVVGLPLSLLAEMLWEFGINVLDIHS
jgi:septum formation protein